MRAIIIAAALAALATSADASALLANCTLKPNTAVKTMPSSGDAHLFWQVSKELAVDVYDKDGSQWAYVTSDDQEYPVRGWVLRSSLVKCSNVRAW